MNGKKITSKCKPLFIAEHFLDFQASYRFYSCLVTVQIALISSKGHINYMQPVSKLRHSPPKKISPPSPNNAIQFLILLRGTQSHKGF